MCSKSRGNEPCESLECAEEGDNTVPQFLVCHDDDHHPTGLAPALHLLWRVGVPQFLPVPSTRPTLRTASVTPFQSARTGPLSCRVCLEPLQGGAYHRPDPDITRGVVFLSIATQVAQFPPWSPKVTVQNHPGHFESPLARPPLSLPAFLHPYLSLPPSFQLFCRCFARPFPPSHIARTQPAALSGPL